MTARLAALGPSPDEESAVLFADEPAIYHLGEQLQHLQVGDWTADLTHPPATGGPVLRQLTVRTTTDALRVGVEDKALVIAGKPAHLARLAEDLTLYAKHNDIDASGMHCHVDRNDYSANDPWIATDSLPLMVAGWVPECSGAIGPSPQGRAEAPVRRSPRTAEKAKRRPLRYRGLSNSTIKRLEPVSRFFRALVGVLWHRAD